LREAQEFSRYAEDYSILMITQVARSDGLALRARRPRVLGLNKTRDWKCECDERAYTYQQVLVTADQSPNEVQLTGFTSASHKMTLQLAANVVDHYSQKIEIVQTVQITWLEEI
jgi:hypothetical protein